MYNPKNRTRVVPASETTYAVEHGGQFKPNPQQVFAGKVLEHLLNNRCSVSRITDGSIESIEALNSVISFLGIITTVERLHSFPNSCDTAEILFCEMQALLPALSQERDTYTSEIIFTPIGCSFPSPTTLSLAHESGVRGDVYIRFNGISDRGYYDVPYAVIFKDDGVFVAQQ
jgi:hypothetical protein